MDIIPVSVLVIESHPLMREALCAAIVDEPDLKVGLQVADGAEALQMLKIVRPDIVVIALGNPGLHELKTLGMLHKSLPEAPILALTSNEVAGQEQAALESGACAVLTKATPRVELISKLQELRTMVIMNHSQVNSDKEENRTNIHSYTGLHR
ncbi:MAG TPA: response regulator transcription factor, partial [Anaerolineales bacterium]|nr:response regulator transcription factor [Anaerolineales bacterium]